MKPLKIGVIDLVGKGPSNSLWARIMHANLASIMPQVVATWCEQEGHHVTMLCYTGKEDLSKDLPKDVDLLFISSFTQAALLAYSLSNYFRSKGTVTVLGGPHARCYPDDAVQYFDFVLGFTNRSTITEVLNNCTPQRPLGKQLSAGKQPASFCGVEERWKFIEPTLKKAPFIRFVPMLGSVGCPYTCSFCIDSTVPYQPLDFQTMQADLRFLLTKFKKPWIVWHDPNFGIRFDENMEAIASAAPLKSFRFIAESSLSILTENHLKVLQQNGFQAILPGIESWFELGNKSRASHTSGEVKVNQWMNFMRAVSSEGWGRIRFYRLIKQNLVQDGAFRKYFEGESKQLPAFYKNIIRNDLGIWWQWLPQGALSHNANAYLLKMMNRKSANLS